MSIFVIVFCVLIQFYFLCNFDLFVELFLSPFKLFISIFLHFYIVSILVHASLDLICYNWAKLWDNFWQPKALLKMKENTFYLTSIALFVLKVFKFVSSLFGHLVKRLDYKDEVNFKVHDFTAWLTNNSNIHIPQYLKK